MDSSDFLDNPTSKIDKSIGCSNAKCRFINSNTIKSNPDCWMHSSHFEIYELPDINQEFNILIPIKSSTTEFPSRIVIAFILSGQTVLG